MSDITIADVTDATTGDDGTGSFDKLMIAVQLHLAEQYDAGRITGENYATVYLGAMQSVLDQAMKFALTQEEAGLKADVMNEQISKSQAETQLVQSQVSKVYAEVALIDQKQITELAQTTTPTGGQMLAKENLIDAQTLGFASDTKQKVLKQMFDGYAVTQSITGLSTPPDAIDEPQIDALVEEVLADVGSSVTIP